MIKIVSKPTDNMHQTQNT